MSQSLKNHKSRLFCHHTSFFAIDSSCISRTVSGNYAVLVAFRREGYRVQSDIGI
jgi:hypothetical protein